MWNPFKRNRDGDGGETSLAKETAGDLAAEEAGIVADETLVAEPIEVNEERRAKVDGTAARRFLDSLVPLGGEVANTINQYGQAIVRFPKDANGVQLGWNDLMHRRTPGWEEWQQLGGLKDGKFQPMAAIRQAKITPAAAANLALQGGAMIVGQAYMAEISNQLEGLQEGIDSILAEMDRERKARLLANFKMLKRYASMADEGLTVPEKRQAVFDKIEDIIADANSAWIFQLESMRDKQKQLSKSKRLGMEEIAREEAAIADMEAKAAAAFALMAAAEQVAMNYEDDHSQKRLRAEQERVEACLADYSDVRGALYGSLHKQIDRMKGRGPSVPKAKEKTEGNANLVAGAAKAVLRQAERFTPAAVISEGRRVHDERKNALHDKVGSRNPVKELGENGKEELDDIDFMYNRADTLIIDDQGIRFASTNDEGEV